MNFNCVKISGCNYTVHCAVFTEREMNLAAAKRAVLALLNETDDYFKQRGNIKSIFEFNDGKIEYYRSVGGI
jgi:hypothetical protein